MLLTSRGSAQLACDCGERQVARVLRVLNAGTHPETLESFLAGRLNLLRCAVCGREFASRTAVFIHDPDRRLYVCCYPPDLQARELELRVQFYQDLLSQGGSIPGYVRDAQFAFGLEETARMLGRQLPASPWQAGELEPEPVEEDLGPVVLPPMDYDDLDPTIALLDPKVAKPAPGLAPVDGAAGVWALEESDFEEVGDLGDRTLRYAQMVRRWRESGQNHYAFLDDGALTILQLHQEPDGFCERGDLFFQLHRLENFPLIVLLLVADGDQGPKRVLYWIFNLDNRIDVAFLEALSERFEVRIHLFDRDFECRRRLEMTQALENNVSFVLEQARAWLAGIDPRRRNFFIAASKFDESGYDRLGTRPVALDTEAFGELPTPAVARLALDILTWWSSRQQYEYLIFIKSFPVSQFQGIVTGVLERAIHFGLALSEKMKRMAVEYRLAGSKKELVESLLSNFADLSRGRAACDLDPAAMDENWQRLLADAEQLGVAVGADLLQWAVAARRQAQENVHAIPLDLSDDLETFGAIDQFQPSELIGLLDQPDHRAAAARALAEAPIEPLLAACQAAEPVVQLRWIGVLAARSEPLARQQLERWAQGAASDRVRSAAQVALGGPR